MMMPMMLAAAPAYMSLYRAEHADGGPGGPVARGLGHTGTRPG